MSLKKKIEELEEQVNGEAQDGNEEDADNEGVIEGAGDEEEVVEDTESDGSEEVDDNDEGDAEAVEEKPNFAKLRVDKTAAEKRAEESERELRELRKQVEALKQPAKQEATDSDPEPNKLEDYEGWLEWNSRQLQRKIDDLESWKNDFSQTQEQQQQEVQRLEEYAAAQNELMGYIADYAREKADTPEVLEHLENVLKDSVRNLNPGYNATQVQAAVNNQIMLISSNAYNQGYDPASVLYQMGIEKGYAPQKQVKEESDKPDLKKITEAKSRSVAPYAGGKRSKAGLTPEEFSKMTTAQKAKLSKAEIAELMENAEQ